MSFKRVTIEVDCGGHVSEATFKRFFDLMDNFADDMFDGRIRVTEIDGNNKDHEIYVQLFEDYHNKTVKLNFFKETVQRAYLEERTDMGKSVLRQLCVQLGVEL